MPETPPENVVLGSITLPSLSCGCMGSGASWATPAQVVALNGISVVTWHWKVSPLTRYQGCAVLGSSVFTRPWVTATWTTAAGAVSVVGPGAAAASMRVKRGVL